MRLWFRPSQWMDSLQFKLMVAVVICVTATMACIGIYWIETQQNSASAQLEAHGERVTRLLARTLAVPVWNIDRPEMAALLDAVMDDPPVYSIELFEANQDGPVMVRTRNVTLIDPIRKTAPIYYRPAGHREAQQLGTLDITYTRYYLYQQLRRIQALIATLVIALLIFLITACYFLFQRLVKKPIDNMVAITRRIAFGDLDARLPVNSMDEFGMLASKFNLMAEQLQQSLQRLTESEEKYRSIIENALESIFQASPHGKLLGANPAMAKLLGYESTDELCRTGSFKNLIVRREDRRVLIFSLKRYGVIAQREIELYRKDKQTVWTVVSARTVFSRDGRVIRIDGVANEITDRKRYQDALAEREAQLRSLVDSNILGVFIWDIFGRITDANDELLRISGYTRQDVGEGKAYWTSLLADQFSPLTPGTNHAPTSAHAFPPYETEIVHRTERHRVPVLIGGTFFTESSERGIAFVLDLSARRQVEAERIARGEAEAASKAKSAFLANMSHELRSPLNVILGFARLIGKDTLLPRQVRNDLDVIRRSAEHLLALINQVLDLAKIEAEHAPLHTVDFDLHCLISDVHSMFLFEAESKNVQLKIEQGPLVPQYVKGDETKLRQVLINLLSNALKFTSQGSVLLRIDQVQDPYNKPRITFSVSDTGAGIAPDELRHLLSPFIQGRAGRLSRQGSGLGLAICRKFVQLMGGELRLASEPGKGTIVTFDLFLEQGAAVAYTLGKDQLRAVTGLAPGQDMLRILIADNNADGRQLLARLMSRLGCEVREASDAQQVVDIWESWRPHLIWLDMHMANLDGREVIRHIRREERGKRTTIIALTASSSAEQQDDLHAIGCDDCLCKPFAERDLYALMQKHFGLRFTFSDQASPPPPEQPHPDALASLPIHLLDQLRRAAIELDPSGVAIALAQIERHDVLLARSLAPLAAEFQYDQILSMIQRQLSTQEDQHDT